MFLPQRNYSFFYFGHVVDFSETIFIFIITKSRKRHKKIVEQPTWLLVGNDNYFSKMNLVKVFCNFMSQVENQRVLVILDKEVVLMILYFEKKN